MVSPSPSFLAGLMLLASVTITTRAQDDCTLACPIDAPCVSAQADFSHHSITLEHGTGMHCSCPAGWTGLLCDHKYESCDSEGNHACYHGGECIAGLHDKYGNDQLFCDCTKAIDGVTGQKYVGKYCETPFDKVCSSSEGEDIFCVNGGDCNPDYP